MALSSDSTFAKEAARPAHRCAAPRQRTLQAGRRGAFPMVPSAPRLRRQEEPAGALGRRREEPPAGPCIVIDSYGHRNIVEVPGLRHRLHRSRSYGGSERAGDLFAMMEWARQQSWVTPRSHRRRRLEPRRLDSAGRHVDDAGQRCRGHDAPHAALGRSRSPVFVGAFIIYPYQGTGAIAPSQGLRVDVPVKAIIGTKDTVVWRQCPLSRRLTA